MTEEANEAMDARKMTAESVGRDLLQALVLELKLLPDVWTKLPKSKQDDVIERLRKRVGDNVKMATHLLASQNRVVVAGELDQITIKGGVKAVVKIAAAAANLHQLYEHAGEAVLVVVAPAGEHTGGMDEVQGDDDQRAMDLGHEYHENDGSGMPAEGQGQTIEHQALPAPEEVQSDPNDRAPTTIPAKRTGELPNSHGVYLCPPDIVMEWKGGKVSVRLEVLQLADGWIYAVHHKSGLEGSASPLMATRMYNSLTEIADSAAAQIDGISERARKAGSLTAKQENNLLDFADSLEDALVQAFDELDSQQEA